MKPRIQLSLLAAGLSLSLAASAFALPVPDGKAAIAEAVIGKVRYDEGQGLKPLHVGDALAPGASIQTGSNGRATLTLAEDAIMRVAPNTEMTLKDEKVRKGTFLELTRGFARFLVGKRSPGYAFEVQTQNAVAAVKGTDWGDDAGDGKGPTKATVFASANPIALLLQSTDGGKSTGIAPGESVSFDGTDFKVSTLSDADRAKVDAIFKSLPPVKHDDSEKTGGDTTGSTGGTTGPGTGGTTGGTGTDTGMSDADKAALKAEMAEITEKAIADASHELYVDGFLLKDTKSGDIAAGKIITDRFGDRVQVSHYIVRDAVNSPDTVAIESYTQRDSGPNKGISSAIEWSQFNQPLPDNWGSVYSRALNDPANLAGGSPLYYRIAEVFQATNPSLDQMAVFTTYDPPVLNDSEVYGQERVSDLYVLPGGVGTIVTQLKAAAALSVGVSSGALPTRPDYEINLQVAVNPDGNVDTDLSDEWHSVSTNLASGGTEFALQDGDYLPILTEDVHLIDDNGKVLASGYDPSSSGGPEFFKQFNANTEVAFGADSFNGRTIDVVFLPGFFGLYDMLNIPASDNPPNVVVVGGCDCAP
jgi:hypothetical protein